jgi:hypothetical protein
MSENKLNDIALKVGEVYLLDGNFLPNTIAGNRHCH